MSMINRCCYKTLTIYEQYGGRGITVCPRWRLQRGQGFVNFLEDMGPRPILKSLDRINVQGHYEPTNCRWADQSTQCSNQRRILFKDRKEPPVVPMELDEEMILAGA